MRCLRPLCWTETKSAAVIGVQTTQQAHWAKHPARFGHARSGSVHASNFFKGILMVFSAFLFRIDVIELLVGIGFLKLNWLLVSLSKD